MAGLSVWHELLPDLCTAVLSGVGVTSPGPGLSTNQPGHAHTLISSIGALSVSVYITVNTTSGFYITAITDSLQQVKTRSYIF